MRREKGGGFDACAPLLLAGVLGGAVAACSDATIPISPGRLDAAVLDAGGAEPQGARLREDFANMELVESSSGAIVDINRGQITLPVASFPTVVETGTVVVGAYEGRDGRIEGRAITVGASGILEATDSVELWATESVSVVGRIRAGPGGISIVAGKSLSIEGAIESVGPVRLRLSDPGGTIEIQGSVRTAVQTAKRSGEIEIFARGKVVLSGVLATGGARDADTGGVRVQSYDGVRIFGHEAAVITGDSDGGASGDIHISTEGHLAVLENSTVRTGHAAGSQRMPSLSAGTIELRATSAEVALATIEAGRSSFGLGGSVALWTSEESRLGEGSNLRGGGGRVAGSVSVEAGQLSTSASQLVGGEGQQSAGRVVIGTGGALNLGSLSWFLGGSGRCAGGGDVVLLVGGRITVADRTAALAGGAGGTEVGSGCFGAFSGGHVQITGQDAEGPLEQISLGGTGTPTGSVSLRLDPRYWRPAPDTRVRTSGWVVSRRFDRGAIAAQQAPRLLSAGFHEPAGTFVKVQLASADDNTAEPEWIDLELGEPATALIGAEWLRYRVFMRGRALDAPVVDFFELELGPPTD